MKLHKTSSSESIPVFGMGAGHLKNTILLLLKKKAESVTGVSDVEKLVSYTLNYDVVKGLKVYISALVSHAFVTGDHSYLESVRSKIVSAIGRESRLSVKPSNTYAHKSVFGNDYEIVSSDSNKLLMKIKKCMSEIPSSVTPVNPMLVASGIKDSFEFERVVALGNSAFDVVCEVCLELVIRGEYENEVLENALLLFSGATTTNNNNDISVQGVSCDDEGDEGDDDNDYSYYE